MGFKALLMGRMKITTQLEMVSKEEELSFLFILFLKLGVQKTTSLFHY